MPVMEPSKCLIALLLGLHNAKSRFTIGNFFNEILDSVAELPSFQVRVMGPHQLVFRIGSIKVTLTPEALIINSRVTVGKDLFACLPKREDKYITLPGALYDGKDDKFEIQEGIEVLKESPRTSRRNFVEESY